MAVTGSNGCDWVLSGCNRRRDWITLAEAFIGRGKTFAHYYRCVTVICESIADVLRAILETLDFSL
jgi:hypothetical protein